MSKEIRYMPTEIRSDGDDAEKSVSGVGILYDEWAELWPGYKERILKGAVKRDKVVKSFVNHDPNRVLSTTKSNPVLELNDTDKGLEFNSPIPPTSYGKDLEINLARNNVEGSSFAFSVPSDGSKRWEEDGVYYREIKKLTLYEIGPVTDPAYIKTSANLKTAEDVYKEFRAADSQEAEAVRMQEEKRKASQEAAKRTRELKLIEVEVS